MPAKGIGYNPTKNKKPKAKKVLKDEKGTFEWERTGTRHGKKKKYLTNFYLLKFLLTHGIFLGSLIFLFIH